MHPADEMMNLFKSYLTGKYDWEEKFYFTPDFLKELMVAEDRYDKMNAIVTKKGYMVFDCKKGEFDKYKNAYTMTVCYLKISE